MDFDGVEKVKVCAQGSNRVAKMNQGFQPFLLKPLIYMVPPRRLERPTPGLGILCSILTELRGLNFFRLRPVTARPASKMGRIIAQADPKGQEDFFWI